MPCNALRIGVAGGLVIFASSCRRPMPTKAPGLTAPDSAAVATDIVASDELAMRRILSPVVAYGINSGVTDDTRERVVLQLAWIEPCFKGGDGVNPGCLIACHSEEHCVHLLQFVTWTSVGGLQVVPACSFGMGYLKARETFVSEGCAYVLFAHDAGGSQSSMTYRLFSLGRVEDGLLKSAQAKEIDIEDPVSRLRSLAGADQVLDSSRTGIHAEGNRLGFSFSVFDVRGRVAATVVGGFRPYQAGEAADVRFIVDGWEVDTAADEEDAAH